VFLKSFLSGAVMTNIVLKSSFGRNRGEFSMNYCHFNAGSAVQHIDELNSVFDGVGLHFMCVSETWFKPRHTNRMMSISGYKLVRSDRTDGRRGGGVGIYIKSGISYKVIAKSTPAQPVDYIFVDLKIFGTRVLVAVIYCPPRVDGYPHYGQILEELVDKYPRTVIMGDLNVDLLKNTVSSRELEEKLGSLSLSVVNTSEPTHFQSDSRPSLIDIFATNAPDSVDFFTQIDLPACNTNHDMIYGSMKFPNPEKKGDPTYFYRDYSRIDIDLLMRDVASVDWSPIYSMPDVDEQVAYFNDVIMRLFDGHVPVRRGRQRSNINPWFNSEIELAIVNRDLAYRSWRVGRTTQLREIYRRFRNSVKTLVRRAKRGYMSRFLDPSLPSRTLYRNLDTIGIRDENDSVNNLCPDRLNAYFSGVAGAVTSAHGDSDDSSGPVLAPHLNSVGGSDASFAFSNVTPRDVFNAINGIKSNSTGLDGIHLRFIKIFIYLILPHITHIFNTAISSATFPAAWKVSKVIPIPKISDPLEPRDYRPISILPALSKALEMVMRDQIVDFLDSNRALNQLQSGFRRGRSTVTALIRISDDVYRMLDQGLVVALVLLDFSKAFDSVNHELLCRKLERIFGFSSSAVRFLKSYLRRRSQCVSVNDASSGFLPVNKGVPQGSVLGPLLFSLFINDLCRVVASMYHVYADDFQIYAGDTVSNFSRCVERLNADLHAIYRWSLENGLVLNAGKTQAKIVCRDRSRLVHPLPELRLGGDMVPYSKSVKNLGIVMDERFSWHDQARVVRRNVGFVLSRLWHFADVTPTLTRRRLVQSLIVPLFLYCDVVYSQSSVGVNSVLNTAFNSCARYVYGVQRGRSISAFSRQILGVPLNVYFDFRKAAMVYRLLSTHIPDYLFDRLQPARSARTLNLIKPFFRTTHASLSFFAQGVDRWNNVPPLIKRKPSLSAFREAYLSHFSQAT
jgi:Reverse transcriptase (RNA-dependent DNA polymerase)/Endonuclease-reverse transcriptase